MGRLQRIAIAFAILAGSLFLLKNSIPVPVKKKFEVATLIHGNEVSSLFGELIETFTRIAPPLKDGKTSPRIRAVQLHPLIVAKGLERQVTDYAMWLAPHDDFLTTREKSSSLSASFTCTPLFQSRLGVIGPRSALSSESSISFSELRTLLPRVFFGVVDALDSATGWSAFKELRCASGESGDIFSAVSNSTVIIEKSEQALLAMIASQGLDKPILGILPEDQIPQDLQNSSKLIFRPIENTRFNPRYSLCVNKSTSKGAGEIAELFTRFMSTDLARDIIGHYGFHPIQNSNSDESCGHIVPDILQSPQLQKAEATVYVIDASSSMDGAPLFTVLDIIRQRAAHATDRDQYGIVSFQSKARILSPITADPKRLIQPLDQLHAEGGSAVYDGVAQGLQLLNQISSDVFLKHLVVITDGQDSNSDTSLFSLLDLLSREYRRSPFSLQIIGVATSSRIPFEPLKEIAHTGHGTFVVISPNALRGSLFE